jgi:uncharacterized membrane protein
VRRRGRASAAGRCCYLRRCAIGGALIDVGINDKWMKETAAAIQLGNAW